jgi:hypothetical protein
VRVLIRSNAVNAPEAEIAATVEPPPVIIDGPPEDDLVAPKLSVSPSSISLRSPGGREFSPASVVLVNTSMTDVMVEAATGVIGLHTSLGGSPVRLAAQQRFTVEIWMGSECSATPGEWLNVTFRTDDGGQHVVRALMLDDEHDLADSPRAAPTTVLDFDDSPRSTKRSGERTVLD